MLQKVNEIISPSFPVIRVFKRRLTNIEDGFILQPFLELKLELKGFKSAWKWFWIVYYDRAAAGWCHCDCTVQWPWLNFYNWGWALVGAAGSPVSPLWYCVTASTGTFQPLHLQAPVLAGRITGLMRLVMIYWHTHEMFCWCLPLLWLEPQTYNSSLNLKM